MKIYLLAGLTGIILSLGACTHVDKTPTRILYFFDIKAYFESEALRLAHDKPLVYKKIREDQTEEEQKINTIDWQTELSVFMNADINRPAWEKSYEEQMAKDGDTSIVTYHALMKNLPIREITIKKIKDKVIGVQIKRETYNSLYILKEELEYYPDKSYNIKRYEKARFIPEHIFQIESLFPPASS